jgi:hypothetical protein
VKTEEHQVTDFRHQSFSIVPFARDHRGRGCRVFPSTGIDVHYCQIQIRQTKTNTRPLVSRSSTQVSRSFRYQPCGSELHFRAVKVSPRGFIESSDVDLQVLPLSRPKHARPFPTRHPTLDCNKCSIKGLYQTSQQPQTRYTDRNRNRNDIKVARRRILPSRIPRLSRVHLSNLNPAPAWTLALKPPRLPPFVRVYMACPTMKRSPRTLPYMSPTHLPHRPCLLPSVQPLNACHPSAKPPPPRQAIPRMEAVHCQTTSRQTTPSSNHPRVSPPLLAYL